MSFWHNSLAVDNKREEQCVSESKQQNFWFFFYEGAIGNGSNCERFVIGRKVRKASWRSCVAAVVKGKH
jgi:hypothetical protein